MLWKLWSYAEKGPIISSYSSDVVPSEYQLFRSVAHGLAKQDFWSYEEVKNWGDSWISSKCDQFFQRKFVGCPKDRRKIGQRLTILWIIVEYPVFLQKGLELMNKTVEHLILKCFGVGVFNLLWLILIKFFQIWMVEFF